MNYLNPTLPIATGTSGFYGGSHGQSTRPNGDGAANYDGALDRIHRERETEFQGLVNRWLADTSDLSSVQSIITHDAYLKIIGMGNRALPLIFREMENGPSHWFAALRAITSVDPVPEASRGHISEMTQAWLEWARREGYA